MITFVPFESFKDSAAVLDRNRLASQRREAVGLLNGIVKSHLGPTPGRVPAMWRMWYFYPEALSVYIRCVDEEWQSRGYQSVKIVGYTHEALIRAGIDKNVMYLDQSELSKDRLPPWLGWDDFHKSHRLKLAWKKWEWYQDKFPDVVEQPIDEPEYIWPNPKKLLKESA